MAAAHAALPGHGDCRKERDAEPLGRVVRRRPRARRRRHLGARPTLRPGRGLVRKGAPDQHRGPGRACDLAPMIPEPPGAAGPIKLGMLAWNQYTTWPAMREAAVAADRLGYDDIWTWGP